MDEDSQYHDKPAGSSFLRHRSPTFSKAEIQTLLNIVEKHKTTVLNKSTSSAACYAKELAWTKIAKVFNKQEFTHVRSRDCLKTKWENLKKDANRKSKNLMDEKYNDGDDIMNQILSMIWDVGSNPNVTEEFSESESNEGLHETEVSQEIQKDIVCNGEKYSDDNLVTEQGPEMSNDVLCNGDQDDSDDNLDADENKRLVNRSINFTTQECNLLLQCARREKNAVFSRANTSKAINDKKKAWTRITNSYNKLSPQKRSTKMLKTKFSNMKKIARRVGMKDCLLSFRKKREKLEENCEGNDVTRTFVNQQTTNQHSLQEDIKCEFDYDQASNLDADEVDNLQMPDLELSNHVSSSLDPLQEVLNSDFGIHYASNGENKDILKLKTELLQFKMETAKLQRKLIEDTIQAETANREAKAIENSLRLRTARLEAIAAEMKLSHTHPALIYTSEETRAQLYLRQYNTC